MPSKWVVFKRLRFNRLRQPLLKRVGLDCSWVLRELSAGVRESESVTLLDAFLSDVVLLGSRDGGPIQ
jgi:hypothetical protein